MELDQLPEDMQDQIDLLKHGSSTVQMDILDALDSAKDIGEFKSLVDAHMHDLIGEAQSALEALGTGKGVIIND